VPSQPVLRSGARHEVVIHEPAGALPVRSRVVWGDDRMGHREHEAAGIGEAVMAGAQDRVEILDVVQSETRDARRRNRRCLEVP